VSLVKGRGDIEFMPAVTAVQLHHSAMVTGTVCSVFSTENTCNFGYACSYCSTF